MVQSLFSMDFLSVGLVMVQTSKMLALTDKTLS